jgi:hypothetical protein
MAFNPNKITLVGKKMPLKAAVGGPIGYCIYGPDHSKDQLSREHVLPKGLGGGVVLLDASCEDCRLKTQEMEADVLGKCWGLFRDANREQIIGRKTKGDKLVEIVVVENGVRAKRKVLVSESPVSIIMPILVYGLGLTTYYDGPLVHNTRTFYDNERWKFAQAVHAPGGGRIEVRTAFSIERICQQLAKIAHGMMHYHYPQDGIKPLLPDLIVNGKTSDTVRYIGMSPNDLTKDPRVKKTGHQPLHQISPFGLLTDRGTYILGYDICLFAHIGAPTYRVYAGETKAIPQHQIQWPHWRH